MRLPGNQIINPKHDTLPFGGVSLDDHGPRVAGFLQKVVTPDSSIRGDIKPSDRDGRFVAPLIIQSAVETELGRKGAAKMPAARASQESGPRGLNDGVHRLGLGRRHLTCPHGERYVVVDKTVLPCEDGIWNFAAIREGNRDGLRVRSSIGEKTSCVAEPTARSLVHPGTFLPELSEQLHERGVLGCGGAMLARPRRSAGGIRGPWRRNGDLALLDEPSLVAVFGAPLHLVELLRRRTLQWEGALGARRHVNGVVD